MDADLGTAVGNVGNWVKDKDAPAETYWAQVSGFDAGSERPLQVTRNWMGHQITLWVYVTEVIKDAYVAGTLDVGDYALVVFVDGELPIATQKVFKSW